MEPRIQYAKTKDGVSIAFWANGSGEPLVILNQLGPENTSSRHLQTVPVGDSCGI